MAATFHSGGRGWGSRQSISNFSYNHIGHFAAGGEAICKALFMGGVTKRFPALKFAFLEGGVGWACSLYHGIIGEWERRNPVALRQLDPAKLDHPLIMRLAAEYGDGKVGAKLEELRAFFHEGLAAPHVVLLVNSSGTAACGSRRGRQALADPLEVSVGGAAGFVPRAVYYPTGPEHHLSATRDAWHELRRQRHVPAVAQSAQKRRL